MEQFNSTTKLSLLIHESGMSLFIYTFFHFIHCFSLVTKFCHVHCVHFLDVVNRVTLIHLVKFHHHILNIQKYNYVVSKLFLNFTTLQTYSSLLIVFILVKKIFFSKTGILCSPGCSGTSSAYQASLEFRDPLASAFQMLALKKYVTKPGLLLIHF